MSHVNHRSSARWVAGATLIVLALIIVATRPAQAAGYDGNAAANYAQKYACNDGKPGACRNTWYPYYQGGDCTNFVSQALRVGGIPMFGSSSPYWWFAKNGNGGVNKSKSWTHVNTFLSTMKARNRVKVVSVNRLAAYSPAKRGDLYIYEFGHKNGEWDHLAMASNWGKFINYYDRDLRKNYNSVTSGYGDKIAQHTRDRDGAPWNWHYWSGTPKDRAANRVYLLKVS